VNAYDLSASARTCLIASSGSIHAAITILLALALTACGQNPEAMSAGANDGWGGAAEPGDSAGGGGNGDTGPILEGGAGGQGGAGVDPCADATCPPEQRCEVEAGEPTCVGNECSDLDCAAEQHCKELPTGALCEDDCNGDVACKATQYCDPDTGRCVDDECVAGEQRCEGDDLLQCLPNGSGETIHYPCESPAPGFVSECSELNGVEASCSCRDDWDCPEHTVCEAGECIGTATPPTCALPPAPMGNVLPADEITWGGTVQNPKATGSPLEDSTQVVLTPLVANLDDDNGDGLIDERDFPEIIFVTFCDDPGDEKQYEKNGILRAIHGGGPNKGGDFFASCKNDEVWHEGEPLSSISCTCDDAELNSTAAIAVGDLDGDGVPEIVGMTESDQLRIFDNTGEVLTTATTTDINGNAGPSLANLDNAGLAEINVGRNVFTLGKNASNDLVVLGQWKGDAATGINGGQGPLSCIADILDDARPEIIAGATAYRFPRGPSGADTPADCSGSETGDEETAWCRGELITLWSTGRDGFCAIADVLGPGASNPGPSNPLDGVPEVVLISQGQAFVYAANGTERGNVNLQLGTGGPPNIDDFDGDGFPEIGTAGSGHYVVLDLQDTSDECPKWTSTSDDQNNKPRAAPSGSCQHDGDCGDTSKFACNERTAQCVCLHNSWLRATQDQSSRVTGSSVFDFNGDGAAEVIYNDECFFRVYEGLDGKTLFTEPSESRTRIEYPVVADVDNDGNAEIVFATTTESRFCDRNDGSSNILFEPDGSDPNAHLYNAGIEVWGDPQDLWVSARRIWNQHAYHVTNVTEAGGIPVIEPPSWGNYNGRQYNTYRSNPRSYGVAPNLEVQGVQLTSPDAACGTLFEELDITVQIANVGDLRVGPGIVVGFYGAWSTPALNEPLFTAPGVPLTATLSASLEPGDVTWLTVSYVASANAPGTLPDTIRTVVDDTDLARECIEDNSVETNVSAGALQADLAISLGVVSDDSCDLPVVPTEIRNIGSEPASNYVVRYYAGNPTAGGTVLAELTRPGPLAPGAVDGFDAAMTTFPMRRDITIWGVVDPDDTIPECNDGNNRDPADNSVRCDIVK
jgi:hypothetical protein